VGNRYDVPAGALALRQGGAASHVLLLNSGQALLRRTESSGVEVSLAICHPGSFLGLGSALRNVPHALTAVMKTAGDVVAIPADRLADALASAELGRAVCEQLAVEQERLIARYAARATPSARGRVVALLRDAGGQPLRYPATIHMTTAEIAGLVGADESHVRRVLRQLRDEGAIDFRRGRIVLLALPE